MSKATLATPFDLELDEQELESLEQLLANSDVSWSQAQIGEIIQARFVSVNGFDYYFEMGAKQEGICSHKEFAVCPKIGEEFVMAVVRKGIDSPCILSKKEAERRIVWQNIAEAYAAEANLNGTIKRVIPAGYIVEHENSELFLPLSQSKTNPRKSKRFAVGKEIAFRIVELKKRFFSAVISHRQIIEGRNEALWDQFMQNHAIGDVVEGIIVKKVSFGLFMEIAGLTGLLHVNDISYKKNAPFKNKFHLKNKVQVKILAADRENNRISLGLKQLREEPWQWAARELKVDQEVKGTVISLSKYGAFIEIREGLEGLVCMSELSWGRKPRPAQNYLQTAQIVVTKIIDIDIAARRLSLSLKQMQENPWDIAKREIQPGAILTGTVTGVAEFGTFVRIREGIDGLIHSKDYSWENASEKNRFKKNQKIRFKILNIDKENQRVSCGIKQLTDSPLQKFQKKHPVGYALSVTVKGIAPFGLRVRLPENDSLEGTVPNSELALKSGQKIEEIYKVGDILQATVRDIDMKRRRIYLSIKDFQRREERKAMKQYIQSDTHASTATPFAQLLSGHHAVKNTNKQNHADP